MKTRKFISLATLKTTLNVPEFFKASPDNRKLFSFFVLFWIGLGFWSILLALLGIFYAGLVAAYLISGAAAFSYWLFKSKSGLAISKRSALILLLSVLAVMLFSYSATPSVFSGRDQGSFSEAAIRLAQNHQLKFSSDASQEFFQIYGPGKALNFPGFNYTSDGKLITQFPLGYIAWLAAFYSIFGLNGFVLANAVSFLIFLLSFYLLSRNYLRFSSSLAAFLLILTSFVFAWFFKFTLSENLAWMLIWFGLLEFLRFWKNNDRFPLAASLLSFSLLAFTRVEAFAFLAVIGLILFWKHKNWKKIGWEIIGKKTLWILGGVTLLFVWNIFSNHNFYLAVLKGLLDPFLLSPNETEASPSFFALLVYIFKVFHLYALSGFLILGLMGIIYFGKNKNWEVLLPFLIIAPAFFYLINPSITLDHPWMLRRFVFAVIPAVIFYAVLFLDRFFRKRNFFYAIIFLLLITNLIPLTQLGFFSPDKNLLPQIEKISRDFRSSDLVLVDREATGDGWSMMAGPLSFLFGKQVVYFFNPEDLAKINLNKFGNVYFIIPDANLDFYRQKDLLGRLSPVKDYAIKNSALGVAAPNKNSLAQFEVSLPPKQTDTTYGKIYRLKK